MFPNGKRVISCLKFEGGLVLPQYYQIITISCNIVSPIYGRKHRKETTVLTCISNWQCVLFQIIPFCHLPTPETIFDVKLLPF